MIMKTVFRHELSKTIRLFIRSIVPMFVLLLSFIVVSCGTTTPPSSKTPGELSTAVTATYTPSDTCTEGMGIVNYTITLSSTTDADVVKTGTKCAATSEPITEDIELQPGYSVQLLIDSNTERGEITDNCTEPAVNKAVYVTISEFNSDGTLLKLLYEKPFCTSTGIIKGEPVVVPDNDTFPFEVTATRIYYNGDVPGGNVMPKPILTSLVGLRSSITTIGDEIHLLYGSEKVTVNVNATLETEQWSKGHYSYNIKTGKWTDLNKISTGNKRETTDAAITSLDNKIYSYGGRYYNEPIFTTLPHEKKKELTVYDTETKTWKTLIAKGAATADMPNNASDLATVNGKIYLFGGTYAAASVAAADNEIYMFDPNADAKWTKLTPAGTKPSARMYHRSVVIGNKIYYYGGVNDQAATVGVVPVNKPFFVFDTTGEGTWTEITTLPSKVRSRFSLLALDSNTLFISSGAASGIAAELSSYIYKIADNKTYTFPAIDMLKSFTADNKSSVELTTEATDAKEANDYNSARSYDYATAYYTFVDGKIYLLRVQPVDKSGKKLDSGDDKYKYSEPKEIEVYTIEIKEKK